MQQMRKSRVEQFYNDKHFGNEPVEVGNVCWVRMQDEEGLHEYPVEVIPDPVLETTESYGTFIKNVKSHGNSGRVNVPVSWVGKRVKVVLLEPL